SGRAAGLYDDRLHLRLWNYAEWSLHLEVVANVIDRAHLTRLRHCSGLAIPDKCIRIDASPQRPANVYELLQSIVALVVIDELVVAVVGVVSATLRRNDVERAAAVGDVVEGVE